MLNNSGERKYLTRSEIQKFLASSKLFEAETQSFCWILAETGCRISELLEIKLASFDFEEGSLSIRCLKKRRKKVFRTIPLSPNLIKSVRIWLATGVLAEERLWPWSRMTAYRRVRDVMAAAGIHGAYATPRGLRHGFAVRAVQANVPLNMVQLWLGHADVKTTTIYTHVTGAEERELASRFWSNLDAGADLSRKTSIPCPMNATRRKRGAPSPIDLKRHFQGEGFGAAVAAPDEKLLLPAQTSPPINKGRPELHQHMEQGLLHVDCKERTGLRHGQHEKALLNLSSSVSQNVKALLRSVRSDSQPLSAIA